MTACLAPGPKHHTDAGHLCDNHLGKLRGWLRDVAREAADVEVVPSLAVSYQPGHGGLASEQVPVRLDALVATDPRHGHGTHETPGDRQVAESAPQPFPVLHRWARVVRQARELTPPPDLDVGTEVAVLDNHLVWCATRLWVGDLYRHVAQLRAGLQRVNGTSDPKPLGRCPRLVEGQECGGPLWPVVPAHTSGPEPDAGPRAVACGTNPTHRWAGGPHLARLALIVAQQGRPPRKDHP